MENVFEQKKKFTLEDYMKFEMNNRKNMGGSLPLMVYRLLEFSLKEELVERLGQEAQIEIFRGAGFRAGEFFVKYYMDSTLGQDEFMAQLQSKLEELNIGILRVEKVSEDGSLTLTVAEDADCSGLPLLGETVCHFDEGFISGIFSTYKKQRYYAIEVDCWATGDRVCRFNVEQK